MLGSRSIRQAVRTYKCTHTGVGGGSGWAHYLLPHVETRESRVGGWSPTVRECYARTSKPQPCKSQRLGCSEKVNHLRRVETLAPVADRLARFCFHDAERRPAGRPVAVAPSTAVP